LTFLDENNEEITIERTKDSLTIYSKDEPSHKEEVLEHYLKGLTKQTYMSIYSFSAIDLLHIRNITEEEFGNILFNVGLAGATNIEIAERNIERETGKIFKKAGRIPLLNKELQNLDELAVTERKRKKQERLYAEIKLEQQSNKEQLNNIINDKNKQRQKIEKSDENKYNEKKLKKQENLYGKIKLEKKSNKEQLNNLLTDINNARQKLDKYNKQLHLLPTINDLKQSKEELKKLPKEINFP